MVEMTTIFIKCAKFFLIVLYNFLLSREYRSVKLFAQCKLWCDDIIEITYVLCGSLRAMHCYTI